MNSPQLLVVISNRVVVNPHRGLNCLYFNTDRHWFSLLDWTQHFRVWGKLLEIVVYAYHLRVKLDVVAVHKALKKARGVAG